MNPMGCMSPPQILRVAFVEIEFHLAHFRVAERPKFHQVVVLRFGSGSVILRVYALGVNSEWAKLACRLAPPTNYRSQIHHGLGMDARIKPRLWRQLVGKFHNVFWAVAFDRSP